MGGWGGDVGFCVLRSRSGDGGGSEFLRSLAQSSRAPRTREGASVAQDAACPPSPAERRRGRNASGRSPAWAQSAQPLRSWRCDLSRPRPIEPPGFARRSLARPASPVPFPPTRARQLPAGGSDWPPHSRFLARTAILKILLILGSGERGARVTPDRGPRAFSSAPAVASVASLCSRAPGPRRPGPADDSMSSSGPAAEGEGTPDQLASEKEPEIPGPREESEEEDEDDDEEEDEEEEKEKSLIVEGKREKKKVERLTMQVSSLQREPFTIAQGKGQKLCEIERIHFFLSKKKTDELRNLHKLLYNRPGTVSSLKKNVGQFSGFPFEKGSTQYKKKEEMLKKFRNAMLKSICEVLDLERSGVNSELVKRILNFLMHPKPSGKPLPKSKKTSSKGNKKERNSSGMARKAKRTKCPEILSDESSSDEDEKKNKEETSEDEDKESEEEPPKKTSKREKPKPKATSKSKKSVKSANVKKADSSTTKKNQNSSKKESESEDSSDDEPLIKKLKKPPTDEELKETVKKLLASANLEEVTMKQICKKVYESYPAYDLTERKGFIKTTVKELIS